MADLLIARNKLDDYKCCANDAITFKLVRHESEVDDEQTAFPPDMSHQLFGDSESIFGYKDLRVRIYCSAGKMITYVNISYADKISPQRFDGIYADDISSILNKHLQPGYLTSKDDFIAQLAKDATFKPYGEKIHSYSVSKGGKERHFEIYKTDIEAPGFRDYHERLQPFLLFYVDAASYIDVDDDRWMFYLLFEKEQVDGNPKYLFAGYMTIYRYYAYPEKIRPRISQVLVMPPFQRMGHGAQLIQTFYNDCQGRKEILDITVEDPSENFQRVRDYVDAKNCMKLESYQPNKLLKGYTEDMALEARQKLHINRKQAKRIYEILRLKATNRGDIEQYRAYRLDIKKRLNMPFQKNGRDFEKLQRALNPNELAATMNNMSKEQRMEYLEKAYEQCVNDYQPVIERLSLYS